MKSFKEFLKERRERYENPDSGDSIFIWTNPTRNEYDMALGKFGGVGRGIIHKPTGDFYMWPGFTAIHDEALDVLGFGDEEESDIEYLYIFRRGHEDYNILVHSWAVSAKTAEEISSNRNIIRVFGTDIRVKDEADVEMLDADAENLGAIF